MLVSIIVPVYNVKPYLAECLDSLINQTWNKLEIVIVNDKSNDGSEKICEEYVKKDKRISLINKPVNQGLGMARNTGLEVIKGKYVIFIDSDDYVSERMVESLVNAAEKTGADTCIGGYKVVDELGSIKSEHIPRYEEFKDEEVVEECLMRIIGSSPEKKDSIRPMVWNVLYSTDIIKKNNLLFQSERKLIAEDMVFDLEYYLHSRKVIIVDNGTYLYRVNNNSITRKKYRPNILEKNIKLYKYELEWIKKNNLEQLGINRLKRQFFIALLNSLKQEVPGKNNLSNKKCREIYKQIVNDQDIVNIVKDYPINKLQIKQRIFLYLIKYKKYNILYLMIRTLYK